MAELRIGVVGSRFAAHLHRLAYRRVYGVTTRLAGVVSPTAERREAFARESGATAYPTLSAMLPHVDVVDVCSPPATHEPVALEASDYLKSWQAQRDPSFAEGRFDDRYERVMERVTLRPPASAPGAGLERISRSCLEVFHATHEFFALHLVTGSHAFRVCSPWVGPHAERLLAFYARKLRIA